MRRLIFLIVGLLELAVAAVLINLGLQLPEKHEVQHGFRSAEHVTDNAHAQVRILRRQVQDLRRPEMQHLANRVQVQTRDVAMSLKAQQVDYDKVRLMRDALGEVSEGLDALAKTLDPESIRKLGEALDETAGFLDERVVPAASKTADDLDASTEALRQDAKRLNALLRDAPLDLKAAREIYVSLGRFDEGLDKMNSLLKAQKLETMRDGFRGLEGSLTTGADQVEKLAKYTYPVMTFDGLKPDVQQKQFWPDGDKIAEGMRKAAAGATAAGKEMDHVSSSLPQLRQSLEESRKVVAKTREALKVALDQQDKVEPLLKDVPQHAARLAEELPKIGEDLSRILRDTKKLREVAAALRQARKGLDGAVERWPELKRTLTGTSKLLRVTRDQLDKAMTNRQEHEAQLNQSVALAETFATMLPLLTEQMDTRLDEEECALQDLEKSLGEVQTALPVYERSTVRVVETGKLLAWLMAAIIGLHGGYLILSARLGPRYSP